MRKIRLPNRKNLNFILYLILVLIAVGFTTLTDVKQIEKSIQEFTVSTNTNEKGLSQVIKVIDGDTIDVEINGKVQRVRLIGINSPETADPRKPVECFGGEAANRTKEILTGKKVRLFNPDELKHDDAAQPHSQHTAQPAQPAQPAQRQGWGVEYDRHETIRESERTSFAAEGVVRTSDGKEIRFQLALEMSREFFQESNISIRAGDAVRKDPLVINFDGNAAQLTDTKFDFDIDSDGAADSISFVGAGSGFLALDKDGNGAIDNGSELFGTQSGDGFAELAAYDGDGNNWIDENDAVYSKLQIWSKDVAGQDTLSTLAQRNIGALYLGNVATPFDLKNSSNDLQGQVRSSGIYLNEDGGAGTMQQIDLLV